MPSSSGPFTPAIGVPITITNPAAGAGNLMSAYGVIVNISPYELLISSGESRLAALVDPFTRDGLELGPAGQQLIITPISVGFTPPAGVTPTIYVLWYLPSETAPAALPAPIVPYGNLQTVSVAGVAQTVPSWGASGSTPWAQQTTKTAHAGAPLNVVAITGPIGIVVTDVSMWLDDPAAFTGTGFALCQSTTGNEYFGQIPAGGTGASEWHSARGLFVPTGHGPNIEVVVSGTYPSNVGVSVTYDQL